MKTLIKSLILSCVIVCLNAQAASHNKLVYINQYDVNQNDEVTLTEFDQVRKQRFDLTDENHNGVVDENEYVFEYQNRMDKQLKSDREGQVRQTAIRFKSLDKNQNQRIEWEEYQASGQWSFNHYDGNSDGVINTDEEPKPRKPRAKDDSPKTAEQIADDKKAKLANAKRILHMPTTHSSKDFFIKYDVNDDGIITKAEHDAHRRADFDLTDEDKNGWLSEEEYLFEFENRLDKQIAKTRQGAIKQTHVRFNILDKDKNGSMTFEEYQLSGHRSFKRWDTNNDQIVSMDDPAPEKRSVVKTKSNDKTKLARQ